MRKSEKTKYVYYLTFTAPLVNHNRKGEVSSVCYLDEYVAKNLFAVREFKSEEDVLKFIKAKKLYEKHDYFFVDKREIYEYKGEKIGLDVKHGSIQYMGTLFTETEVKDILKFEKMQKANFQCLLPIHILHKHWEKFPKTKREVGAYIQSFANGYIFPVFEGERVFDEHLKQIYPAVEKSKLPIVNLKNQSR